MVVVCKLSSQCLVGFGNHKSSLAVELNQAFCVDKIKTQEVCNQHSIKVFSSAGDVVSCASLLQVFLNSVKVLLKVCIYSQVQGNCHISVFDNLENLLIRQVVLHVCLAQVQQIGNLAVTVKSLSRCRNYNIFSVGICKNNVLDLSQLDSVSN